MQIVVYLFLFVILVLFNGGWCSVSLSDPDKICKEKNIGSHTVPGKEVKLNCDVNNTGVPDYLNFLIWTTPVIMEINSETSLLAESSTSLHTITYSGNISDTNLTVMMMTDNDDVIHYNAMIDQNYLNISSNATFNGNSTNITLTVRVKSENTNSTNYTVTLNSNNSTFSFQRIFVVEDALREVSIQSRSNKRDLILSNSTLKDDYSIFSATATFNGDLANSTLTFTATESLDDDVVSCRDNLGNSENCTLQIYTTPNAPSKLVNTSVTYQSVSILWTAPNETGGRTIMNYIITVTPSDGSAPWNITTTDNSTSYTVIGLMFGQTYKFKVRANYNTGPGNTSNIVPVTLPGEVPHPVSVDICMDYVTNGSTKLNISWNPCPPIFNTNTTPPIDNYTLSISHHGNPINLSTCNHSQSVIENTYTVSVTANNIVGPSKMITVDFNARWLTNVTHKSGNMAKVEYTTAVCIVPVDLTVKLTYNNDTTNIIVTDTKSYVANTTDSFILSSLQPGATISYALQVIDTNSNTIGSANTGSFMIVSSLSSSSPSSSPLPSSVMPTTTDLSATIPWAAVGGGIGGFTIVLILIISFFVVGIVSYKKKSKHNDSDGPIALVETKSAVPETGKAVYQDPTTIEHQQAPTGDLYAMPDKGKGKGSRRQVPTTPSAENATYQDPTTTEQQKAPTGDLYAMPEKKPKYSEVQKQNGQSF